MEITDTDRWEFLQNTMMKIDTRQRSNKLEFLITYPSKKGNANVSWVDSVNIKDAIDKAIKDSITNNEASCSSVEHIPHSL